MDGTDRYLTCKINLDERAEAINDISGKRHYKPWVYNLFELNLFFGILPKSTVNTIENRCNALSFWTRKAKQRQQPVGLEES